MVQIHFGRYKWEVQDNNVGYTLICTCYFSISAFLFCTFLWVLLVRLKFIFFCFYFILFFITITDGRVVLK